MEWRTRQTKTSDPLTVIVTSLNYRITPRRWLSGIFSKCFSHVFLRVGLKSVFKRLPSIKRAR